LRRPTYDDRYRRDCESVHLGVPVACCVVAHGTPRAMRGFPTQSRPMCTHIDVVYIRVEVNGYERGHPRAEDA
jgi:hypothetical protein